MFVLFKVKSKSTNDIQRYRIEENKSLYFTFDNANNILGTDNYYANIQNSADGNPFFIKLGTYNSLEVMDKELRETHPEEYI